MARPSNQINLFQIDDGFVYLGRNEPLVVIENIPIIDIPNGAYFGDEDETVLTFAINPLYREILEGADYRLFSNHVPTGVEDQIYANIMRGFTPQAVAPTINAQADVQQWHSEWQIIPHDPNMYNIDHILAAHNPQNDFPIVYQGVILPSFNGIFSNISTNEIWAFFVLVGIAFYIGNEYNGIGGCG